MSFSDDDLKRLKEELGRWLGIHTNPELTDPMFSLSSKTINALLARLEAAEECVKLMLQDIPLPLEEKALKAWRKACGE